MEVKSVHLIRFSSGEMNTSAKVEVEGLGEISITSCISNETVKQIEAEVLIALKKRMGQPC